MATDNVYQSFFERHHTKIEFGAPSGCWLWSACADRHGYGLVKARGRLRFAHREAYEAEGGVGSADGLVVRHKCDMPLCVNPDHLVIGTHADNARDMAERGRNAQPKGEAHGNAKLTEADVRAIRAVYIPRCRTHSQDAIAQRFGVAQSVISDIIHHKSWSHVA